MGVKQTVKQLCVLVITVTIYCMLKAIFIFTPLSYSTSEMVVTETDVTVSKNLQMRSAGTLENQTAWSTTVEFRVLKNLTTCSSDDGLGLGLTKYATQLCVNQSSDICDSLTCKSLLTGSGNDLYYGIARKLMSSRPRSKTPDSFYENATRDCDAFKRDMGYHLKPLSREEEEFPLAFNFLVHTDVEQVELQLRALYRPQNLFCIHVDAKAPVSFTSAIRGIANCFENVYVASKLEVLTWGGYNRLQADINCMWDHFNTTVPWKYLINTAGLAYPLKTIGEMVKVLKIYNGANDIEGIYGNRVLKSRFEKEWVENPKDGSVKPTGKKNPKPPHDIDIVRGSAYGIFSRKFVQFILTDKKAINFREWSKHTWSPDELYWATLHHTYSNPHLHTPGGFSGYPSNKEWLAVYANWYSDSCHGRMVRGVCIFGVGDLPQLISRREFFANKFYLSYEPLALECIASWIRQKELCPPTFDAQYYESLPFVR